MLWLSQLKKLWGGGWKIIKIVGMEGVWGFSIVVEEDVEQISIMDR